MNWQCEGFPSRVRLEPTERSSLVMAPMMAPIVAAVPADRRLAQRAEIRAADLAGEDVILLGWGSYRRHIIEVALGGLSIRSTVETPLSAIACALASEGVSIALIEASTTRAFVDRGVVVLPLRPAMDSGFSLVTARKRAWSQAARDFLGVVEAGAVDDLRPVMGAIVG